MIGIQYQQGLKDLAPASDLVEGLLNNVDRPPVKDPATGQVLFEGKALPHFNEVDECAGLDALVTNRVWNKLGFDPETTLHDVRYGETYQRNGKKEFVWVFEISGAVPPQHLIGGYAGTVSERQPPMYFPIGGGTVKGISKPGEIVWSRVFVENGELKADIGRAKAVEAAPRRERAALEHHHAAVAHDARRYVRRLARPVHGPAQGQPHPGGLCPGRRGRQSGAGGQGRHVPRDGHGSQHLRHGQRAVAPVGYTATFGRRRRHLAGRNHRYGCDFAQARAGL